MNVRACRPRRKLLHCGSSYGAAGNSPLGKAATGGATAIGGGTRRPPSADAATGPRGEAAGRPSAPPASRGRLSLLGGEPVGVLSALRARQRTWGGRGSSREQRTGDRKRRGREGGYSRGGGSRGSCWESLSQTTEAPTDRVRVWTRPSPTPTRGAQNAAQIKGNGRVRTTACTGVGTATSTVHSEHGQNNPGMHRERETVWSPSNKTAGGLACATRGARHAARRSENGRVSTTLRGGVGTAESNRYRDAMKQTSQRPPRSSNPKSNAGARGKCSGQERCGTQPDDKPGVRGRT
eukprot:gene7475-biopygen10579